VTPFAWPPHLPLDRAGGALRSLRKRHERTRQRAIADERILWGAVPRASAELLTWRASELTSPYHRAELARLCGRFVAERGNPRCRAYAVNRQALADHLHLLVELAERLDETTTPVTPQGVILAERVLCDGAGPLFNSARADLLRPMLIAALATLEGDGQSPTSAD
jgi:hypothetical protein